MNLYIRFFWLIFRNLLSNKRVHFADAVENHFRVLPNDIDLNWHMNNGRYLTIMDLGRFEYMAKTGMFQAAVRRGWYPILGASQMVYFRPLNTFQKYKLITTLECWDEKWVVITQKFISRGKICALGRIRGLIRGPQGNVPPSEVLAAAGFKDAKSPSPSDAVKAWLEVINNEKREE